MTKFELEPIDKNRRMTKKIVFDHSLYEKNYKILAPTKFLAVENGNGSRVIPLIMRKIEPEKRSAPKEKSRRQNAYEKLEPLEKDTKLSIEQAGQVKFLFSKGWKRKTISLKLDISYAQVTNVISGKTMKDAKPIEPQWFFV